MNQDIGQHRVLNADARKWTTVSLIGAGFLAIGLLMIINKGDFLAWFVTLFFGGVAATGIYQLFGPGSHLELNPDTFTVSSLGRQFTERWDECADFAVYRTGHNRLVAYDRAGDVETHMAEMNRMLSGRSASLPDTFGMKAQALADLMNAYQAHALKRAWERHSKSVAAYERLISGDLKDAAITAEIISSPKLMSLPADMPPWPSILVVGKKPHQDDTRHILTCVDILSPRSRWIPRATKQKQAFELLGADELQIIDPDTNAVHRIARDNT
jgi:hypothetical protein